MTIDVKERALKLLHDSNAYRLPIDVKVIATNFLKIKLAFEDFEKEISGVLLIKNGQAAIGVNRNHSTNRQRFSIAHEIGHYVLHHHDDGPARDELFVDKKWSYSAYFRSETASQGVDDREIQANRFAAELLMPEELVRNQIVNLKLDLSDDFDIFRLASILQVSGEAITIRLLNLKLIRDE